MKRIIYHDQIEFIIGMKRWFNTFKITGRKPTVAYINRLYKAYLKTQHLFMRKRKINPRKVGYKRNGNKI